MKTPPLAIVCRLLGLSLLLLILPAWMLVERIGGDKWLELLGPYGLRMVATLVLLVPAVILFAVGQMVARAERTK